MIQAPPALMDYVERMEKLGFGVKIPCGQVAKDVFHIIANYRCKSQFNLNGVTVNCLKQIDHEGKHEYHILWEDRMQE